MFALPNDPFYPSQWGFENTGQTVGGITGTPGADINAPAAWDLTTGSKNVVLVDFDTGIDYNNPDLAPNVWSAPSAYTITEGGNVYNCPAGSHGFNAVDYQSGCAGQEYDNGADYGHGTITAGVMGAAGSNGIGIAGTDWNATILAITICTAGCDSSTAVTGIDAALQIASRFGLRLAAGNFSHGNLGGSALEDEMILAGSQTGIVFTASTGDDCGGVEDPASFYLPNELAVSGSDLSDRVATWPDDCSSSGGDVAAPGLEVYSTTLGDSSGSNPHLWDGTSVSAPFVAGAVGLIESVCPLPPTAVKATIEGTADEIPALTGIATNGRRLNLGNAVASCAAAGRTAGSGTVTVYLPGPIPDHSGTMSVTLLGNVYSYYYDTAVDDTDSVGEALAGQLGDNPYVSAVYEGNGVISVTTLARGPYTGYQLMGNVQDSCNNQYIQQSFGGGGGGGCGDTPSINVRGIAAGN